MLADTQDALANSSPKRGWVKRALKLEWLGQTAASLLWITSVFIYGISSTGDWFQLFAASAWFVANIATLFSSDQSENDS